MSYYAVKIAVTTLLVVVVSEIAKRSTLIGAVIASVPVVSVLAIVWLYAETGDVTRVSMLSKSIVWLVLPSIVLFIVLPALLERGVDFYASLAIAVGATMLSYSVAVAVARQLGFQT